MTESLATALRCIDCASDVALGYRLQCPSCGGLLELIRPTVFRLTVLRDGQQVELSAPR